MSTLPRLQRILIAVIVAVGMIVLLPSSPAGAASTVPFTPKFSSNANGAMVSIGNNLLTCPASAGNCASARAGASLDNNSFAMVNLDADSDASTFNSSSSTLALPAGATVLWAGLYWGARLDAGSNGSAGSGAYNQMSLRTPGAAAYRTIAASTAAHDQFGPNGSSYNAYQRLADITSIVQAAGNGAYWGGNVVAATGQDRYAGWAMTVVYTAPGLPLRNLTVFDGFNVVSQGSPQNITVSGFQAPLAGTVDAQLTMVAYEGDLSQTGDYTKLNNTQLATAVSPGSNFFDSINSLSGASVTTRTPADRNMLGYDIKNLGASGAIPNGATSATFTFSSNGDVYYPGVLGMAINLYAPDFTASSKTVVDVNGNTPARPGDTLQYTLNFANTGQDPAVRVVSNDQLPANTTYVPGSLQLVSPAGATTPLSDGSGDDAGEYDAATRTVRVRLGGGANAATGGRMACSGSGCTDDGTSRAAYTFQVTLDNAAGGTTVTNLANLDYRTATTNIAATYTTNPASVEVIERADLSIRKVMAPDPTTAGAPMTATITVTNNGPNTARGVTMSDPIIEGWNEESIDAPAGVSCTVDATITCDLGAVPSGTSVVIVVHGHDAASSTRTTLTNVASVSTTSYDPDLTNNVSSATISVVRAADLAVTKTTTPASAAPGATVTYRITATNNGASDARNVVIGDTVANTSQLALADVTGTTGGATCGTPSGGSLRCTVDTLTAGASATVTLTGVLAPNLAAGTSVADTATVASDTADPVAGNNQATASTTVAAPAADMRLTKTGPASAYGGGPITYTVTATNYGPSDAVGVTVRDTVPDGITVTSATTDRGTCTVAAQVVTCTAATVPAATTAGQAGGSIQITISGSVDPGATGSLANTATVTSTSEDPDASNNSARATTALDPRYDLSVTKTANRTSLPGAARTVTYIITVRNAGPSTATGVTLSDLVPTALVFDSVTPQSGGSCDTDQVTDTSAGDADHGLLTCRLAAPIAPGATQTVTVVMHTTGPVDTGPDITETATVHGTGDTDASNNSATWTLSGEPYSDLELTKTAPAAATAGTRVDYHFDVTNVLFSDPLERLVALAPTLHDTLPPGVTFLPAGAPGRSRPRGAPRAGRR